MQRDRNLPRTLWRVTNRNDFVATGLPELGDSYVVDIGKGKYRKMEKVATPHVHTNLTTFLLCSSSSVPPCPLCIHSISSTDNLFNFGHLGVEIYMKSHPQPCLVRGDACRSPSGYKVYIGSSFDQETVLDMREEVVEKGWNQPTYIGWLQYIPIAGRLAAHATTNYWVRQTSDVKMCSIER